MNNAIVQMLQRYKRTSLGDEERALREVLQEVALAALYEAGLFEKAAFYGGTALRIFYGLDRFSEDLDFTLLSSDPKFEWTPYKQIIIRQMAAFGFDTSLEEKVKRDPTGVQSAFLKANTLTELLKISVNSSKVKGLHPHTTTRIKIEIDTDPPIHFPTENRYLRGPVSVPIRCVTEQGLFAGKMNAALFRAWKQRVKGRDWYDLVWFIQRGTPLDLSLFSRIMGRDQKITHAELLQLLSDKLATLDMASARQDIETFIEAPNNVSSWSQEFFLYWIKQMQVV